MSLFEATQSRRNPGMSSATQRSGPGAGPRESRNATPAVLSNLGRATLRGIRKCPRCGFYNGTRGFSCKNKACGIALRDVPAGGRSAKKPAVQVVRVVTNGAEQANAAVEIFSVCQRGQGAAAAQLGFVELIPTDTAIATEDGDTLTMINLGRCFMPSCQQDQMSSQSQFEESAGDIALQSSSSDSLCAHIKQAMECQSRATPLTLKSSVLEGLQSSVEIREQLWNLATASTAPLVQQVSKDTLVVKCNTDSNHPLGFLHLTIGSNFPSRVSKRKGKCRKGPQQHHPFFHCACQSSAADRAGQPGVKGSSVSHCLSSSAASERCLHFYACVCAFASDINLASDFAAFINYSLSDVQQSECRIRRAPDASPQPPQPISSHYQAKRLCSDESLSESTQAVDEQAVTMGFHQWLASVTERIHQTMHYQFDGKPDPLVFHIPLEFFSALERRFSVDSQKRRLPNETIAFVRNDSLPLGSFSKYTWHITELSQVKHIFDTPELPLELTQSFVENTDGSYSHFHCSKPPTEAEVRKGNKLDKPQAARPTVLCTFLKVGLCETDQKEPTPFVIEWIPDILPRSGLGELKISFKFGHQQSAQNFFCDGTSHKNSGTEKGSRPQTSVDSTQPNHSVTVIQVIV
ncbi:uncharacterized protein C2orf42 homolog isoform X2 [Lampris incognitus]|uniref:uncharacterized protein C2orf42 homolog isoform X2 n=1 Tax=Lampris incognitus TaxID=2546036 RepID=UPI0024B5BBAC|nr:uncharacterized protein C2orf42 homolog isoform X2 [Lampris incognitus]